MAFITLPALPPCDDATLARCVREVVEQQLNDVAAPSASGADLVGRLPSADNLERWAAKLVAHDEHDPDAIRFDALVELCFLVALADDLALEERAAMAELVSQVGGEGIDTRQAEALFDGYAARLERDGIERRLDSVAAPFSDHLARQEATSFAALVAIADRKLAGQEAVMLLALSNRFEQSKGEVQLMVDCVARALTQAIQRATA